jgi:hypothetical protein
MSDIGERLQAKYQENIRWDRFVSAASKCTALEMRHSSLDLDQI